VSERILIIDDDVDTLKLVGLMLERQGYEIIVANNGEQGLSKTISERPDLILKSHADCVTIRKWLISPSLCSRPNRWLMIR